MNRGSGVRVLAGVVLCAGLAAGLWLQREQPVHLQRSRLLLGTVVEIELSAPARNRPEAAIDAAFAELARIEALMSLHRPDSELSRLARAPSRFEVSPETAEVLTLALEVARRSGGAFDPALAPLRQLWNLEGERPRRPDPVALRQALDKAGPGAVELQGRWVLKRSPEVGLDLGGIAKGFAVDRATTLLAQADPEWGVVNAGGDMRLLGRKSGQDWRIGIQHPRQPEALLAVLSWPHPAAVVTSGDYERAVEIAGESYHHLFDPRTGDPARACQSVTVVAEQAMLADALATAAFVLGPEQGLRFLEEWPGVEGLLVATDGTPRMTTGLAGRVAWR